MLTLTTRYRPTKSRKDDMQPPDHHSPGRSVKDDIGLGLGLVRVDVRDVVSSYHLHTLNQESI